MIRIRSKKAGFRRCGIAHPVEWVEHPDDAFTPDQIERLTAEPMLQVEVTPELAPEDDERPIMGNPESIPELPGAKRKRQ